ncbi:hypothetical protein [Streptomyces sp. NPDC019890]|uniref:hypothetical protein n=1 Tax=Streptomyces sp. NPDC019890 TaxID=3365064 RepID=UPI00384E93C3
MRQALGSNRARDFGRKGTKENMNLQYHQRALALAGEPYIVSASAVAALDELEARGNIDLLPASLREWYSLDSAVRILQRHSDDIPYAVADLGRSHGPYGESVGDDDAPHPIDEQNLLPFMIENQGVCYWAVRLDGSPDPEVLITYEDFESWFPCSASFSEFAYSWVWDRPGGYSPREESRHASSQGQRLAPTDLTVLAHLFEPRPETLFGVTEVTGRTHRFAGADDKQRIRLETGMSDGLWGCELWAASDALLADLITTLHSQTSLTKNLRPIAKESAASRVIAAVLPDASG